MGRGGRDSPSGSRQAESLVSEFVCDRTYSRPRRLVRSLRPHGYAPRSLARLGARHTRDEEGTTSSCGANERSVSSKLAFSAQEHDFSFVGSAVGPLERCFATHGSAAPVALPDSVAEGRRLDRVARKSPGRKFGRDGHAPSLAGQSARGHPFLEAPRQWSPPGVIRSVRAATRVRVPSPFRGRRTTVRTRGRRTIWVSRIHGMSCGGPSQYRERIRAIDATDCAVVVPLPRKIERPGGSPPPGRFVSAERRGGHRARI